MIPSLTVAVDAAPRVTASVINAAFTCAPVPVIVCALVSVTVPVVAVVMALRSDAAIEVVASLRVILPSYEAAKSPSKAVLIAVVDEDKATVLSASVICPVVRLLTFVS